MAKEERRQPGTVLICYDGSDTAKAAIAQSGRQLGAGRQALVLTVWEPFVAFGFSRAPIPAGRQVDEELGRQAEDVAAEGSELARQAGFDAESLAQEGGPVWTRIVQTARERDVDLIVLGSHGRSGLSYVLMGSVATAVSQHARRPVLIVSGGDA